jgi:hypothetical protein
MGETMSSLPSPDDIRDLLGSPFVSQFWPIILGGIAMFIGLVMGNRKAAFGLLALAGIGQAWHMGLFGT